MNKQASYELSFSDAFWGDPYTWTSPREDRASNVADAIDLAFREDKEWFLDMLEHALNYPEEALDLVERDGLNEMVVGDVLEKIEKTNTCGDLSVPVDVWIDPEGWYTLDIWDDQEGMERDESLTVKAQRKFPCPICDKPDVGEQHGRPGETFCPECYKKYQEHGRGLRESDKQDKAFDDNFKEDYRYVRGGTHMAVRTSEDRFYQTTLYKFRDAPPRGNNQDLVFGNVDWPHPDARVPYHRYSYESTKALYDVDVNDETGEVTFQKNCRPSEREKYHDIIIKHFNIQARRAHRRRAQFASYKLVRNHRYNGDWWEVAAAEFEDGVADVDESILDHLWDFGYCRCDEDEGEQFMNWAESLPQWEDENGEPALLVEVSGGSDPGTGRG